VTPLISHRLQRHQLTSVIARIAFAALALSPFSNATCSSPRRCLQVPVSLHVKYFCYRRFFIRSPSLAVAPNARHLRFVSTCVSSSGSALHELGPAQDHALGEGVVTIWRVIFIRFRMFHRYTFVLGAPVRSLVVPLHIILEHCTTSPSFQRRAHYRVARPIHLLASICSPDLFAYDAARSVAGWTSTLQAFLSLFPLFSHSRA